MASFGKPIVSYGDTLLRESDVDILDGPYWLNDNLISFYFQYLENEVFKEHTGKICFISAETTQLIKSCTADDVKMLLSSFDLHEKELVFFPINDCAITTGGGSHWSLLVYIRKLIGFKHFDSCGGSNIKDASRVARNIFPLVAHSNETCIITNGICAQQANSYDCGLYVLHFAEILCKIYCEDAGSEHLLLDVDKSEIHRKREELKEIIYSISNR